MGPEAREANLQLVASTYTSAALAGIAPARAVQTALGSSRPTAQRRIALAREAGLMPTVPERTKVARNKRAVAVAAALGVSYDDLMAAVRTHANGDLRV